MTRRMPQSLTLRLTLLFSLAALLVLLVLGAAVNYSINQHFIAQDVMMLTPKLTHLQQVFSKVRNGDDLQRVYRQLQGEMASSHGLAIVIMDIDGKVLFPQNTAHAPFLINSNSLSPNPFIWKKGSETFRGISSVLEAPYNKLPKSHITVGLEISHHKAFLASFQRFMWGSVVIAVFIMGLLSWLVARHGLLPLKQLIATASKVTADKLDYRLPVDSIPLELKELTNTLNNMLSRLEDSFKRLSDFSSDLAHELRTPISSLKTQTQVALSRTRTVHEYQEILYSNAEELDHMARMVSDMLFLAKSDNGLIIPNAESINLKEEVQNLFEFYEALAETRSLKLFTEGSETIVGDRLMLRRAVSNLLSNAIAYSQQGSSVNILIKRRNTVTVGISIESHGETISPEHLSRLFDRFYRMDSSRIRSSEGVGLGLAITHSIIKAHGGNISVRSDQGRTCFDIELPVSQI